MCDAQWQSLASSFIPKHQRLDEDDEIKRLRHCTASTIGKQQAESNTYFVNKKQFYHISFKKTLKRKHNIMKHVCVFTLFLRLRLNLDASHLCAFAGLILDHFGFQNGPKMDPKTDQNRAEAPSGGLRSLLRPQLSIPRYSARELIPGTGTCLRGEKQFLQPASGSAARRQGSILASFSINFRIFFASFSHIRACFDL